MRRQRGADRLRGGAEQLVAGDMAVEIVDRLEMIEIDHHQRRAFATRLRLREQRGAAFRQRAAIEKAGERIL